MNVTELGEFPLIARLQQIVETQRSDIITGIGDDVAVLAGVGDDYLLATVDSMVENVHFLRHLASPRQIGQRALTINLSDIAAAGGKAEFALVALVLPTDTEVAWVEELYRGIRAEADRYGVAVVGGNITSSPTGLSVDITVLGRVPRDNLVLRSGARPGDRVLVSGLLGDAAAALQLEQSNTLREQVTGVLGPAEQEALLSRYLTPTARLHEAAVLAHSRRVSAMIDISDGLSSDVGHICDRSSVGVRLWAAHLPISAAVRSVAAAAGMPAWRLALKGGDDYELCLTAPLEAVDDLAAAVQQATGTPLTVVGEIVPAEQGRWIVLPGNDGDGKELSLTAEGWQHFRRQDEQ